MNYKNNFSESSLHLTNVKVDIDTLHYYLFNSITQSHVLYDLCVCIANFSSAIVHRKM